MRIEGDEPELLAALRRANDRNIYRERKHV